MKPIHLWSAKPVNTTDEAGIQISVTQFPSLEKDGPPLYEASLQTDVTKSRGTKFKRLPKLQHFCIKALVNYPEQMHALEDTRLELNEEYDVLHTLIPKWSTSKFSIAQVDPRLWAVLAQVYSNLPPILSTYPISLSDKHLPLLQFVPSTPDFALITVLDLRKSKNLRDETIFALKALHNLCVLDIGGTEITADGIRRLALTVTINGDGERRGPWTLRVLRMVDCTKMDGTIFRHLAKFVLLTALDLRGTGCTWKDIQAPFCVSEDEDFFEPRSAFDAVQHLAELGCHTLPSTNYRTLQVFENLSRHGPSRSAPRQSRPASKPSTTSSVHNSFVVLPASTGSTSSSILHPQSSRIQYGNADLLEGGQIGPIPQSGLPFNSGSSAQREWSRNRKCRACGKLPRLEESASETSDSDDDDMLDNPYNYEGMDEAYALYLRDVERRREKQRSREVVFCNCAKERRPFEEPLRRMGMTVTNPAQPSSFYESRQQRMPARRMDRVRSTGLIVSRSPPDWNILESIPRMTQRRNTAVPSSNTMVATKASLKGSEKMKALTDILGKRKREIVDCKPSSLLPKAVNISPPRKLLKPISNIKPPDAPPPPRTKSRPRLKLEPTAPTISSPTAGKPNVVVSSRVSQSKDSTPPNHTGYAFDLKNSFNFQSKCAPVPPKSTTTVVHVDTLKVGSKSQGKLPSKPKFNWSEWGRKS